MHDDLSTTNGRSTLATATIIGSDSGGNITVAIDQSTQNTSQTTQIILTTESTSFSSVSMSHNSLHHQQPQSHSFSLINNGLRHQHQLLNNGVNNVNNVDTPSSSSTNVIVQATSINSSGSPLISGINVDGINENGVLMHHQNSNNDSNQQNQHHNHINLINSPIPSSSSIIPNGTVLVSISSKTSEEQNSATPNIANNNGVLQIITTDQTFNEDDDDEDDDDDPMHIIDQDGLFSEILNDGKFIFFFILFINLLFLLLLTESAQK